MKKIIKLAIILLVTGLFFTGIIYASSIPTVKQTLSLATTIQPERFTELYFEDHTKLPSYVELNQQYSFSFTVHNLEYKDITYQYESYIQLSNKKEAIDKGTFTLKHDQYRTVKQNFSLIGLISRSKIVVNLINKNQKVDFWIEGAKETAITPISTPLLIPLEKQYGGWYWQTGLKKAQIWLGKDGIGKDIWSEQLPSLPSALDK